MNTKIKFLLTAIFSAGLILASALFSLPFIVKAGNSITTTAYLPKTKLEYEQLDSPFGSFSCDKVTAIMQATEPNNSLLVYFDGAFKEIDAPQLTEVNLLDDNTLIYSSSSRIIKLDLISFASDPTNSLSQYELKQKDQNSDTDLSVAYFDLNAEYLVTAYDNKVSLIKIGENRPSSEYTIDGGTHVAINDNNEFFYVLDGKLYKRDIANLAEIKETLRHNQSKLIPPRINKKKTK